MPDIDSLNAAIDEYSAQSFGSGAADNGELSRQRSLALDAYSGKMLVVPPEGRSRVNDRSVFETVQWMMPSFMRIFAGGDNVVEFEPFGPEDEEIAEQESDYLNYLVTQRNDWDLTVREWCQDALITKNAYCLVDMEERLEPEIDRYLGQSEQQLALILEDDVEIVGQRQYDDPNDDGTILDPVSGEPIDPNDVPTMLGAMAIYQAEGREPERQFRQLFDLDVKKVKAKKQLKFEVLPPERCRVGTDTRDFTLEQCNYFEYWDPDATISDLRKLGYEIDDDIGDMGIEWTDEDSSRNEPLEDDSTVESMDPSMRRVTLRTIWIRHDYDEDGIAELQRVIRVGNTILDHEPASRIPVASIVPFINTHRHMGNSVADLMFEVQNIKTKMLRSGLDGLELSLNPGHVISKKVQTSDMLVSRPGRLVRLKDGAVPGEGHIMPLTTENVFPMAMQGLQHMDTVTEARVGVNRMFQGIDSSNLNDHDRVGQLSTMAAQRIEDIARLFGTGFKRLFSLAHELVIKSGHSGESVKLRGKWVDVDPTQWRTGRDMRVTAPFAAGNKDSLIQRLMIIGQIQEKMMMGGLLTVDPDKLYNWALEISKAADLAGNKFFTDPSTVEPAPPAPDPTMLAVEIENKKAENEALDEARKAEIEKEKIQSNEAVEKYKADLNAELQITLAKINAGKAIDVETVRASLKETPIEIEGRKLSMDDIKSEMVGSSELVGQLAEALADAQKELVALKESESAPIKIVRENGKIVGRERNGVFTPLEDL